MTERIDTSQWRDDAASVMRSHGGNPEALLIAPWWMDRVRRLCDEVDRLRAVRDAAQRVVDGDWRDDDLDVWDALGMITAAQEADRG